MATRQGQMFTVTVTGNQVATSAASAGTTLPLAQSGEVPRYIRINSSQPCYFKMGVGTQTATVNDVLITGATFMVVPRGYNNWAALQVSVAGACQVSPLEDC